MPFNPNQPELIRLARRYAEKTRRIVFWVGAGLSLPAKLPSWGALKKTLHSQATETVRSMDGKEAEDIEEQLQIIERSSSYWDDFEQLKAIIGEASFVAAVRDELTPKTEEIPSVYKMIWDLDVHGVINLNLDPLAKMALQSSAPDDDYILFNGFNAGIHAHALKDGRKFIAHVHGTLDQHDTWVFTKSDLKRLLNRPAYKSFISNTFSSSTVIFLGISADDVAAGGLLAKLKDQGIESGEHYWITHRTDTETHRWAQNSGLQVVRYSTALSSPPGDHNEPISEIFSFLKSYVSKDAALPPVLHPAVMPLTLPPKRVNPDDLIKHDVDYIRKEISSYTNALIEGGHHLESSEFKKFLYEYRKAIQLCWIIEDTEPENVFFDYVIEGRIGGGVFSDVYKAYAPDGTHAAIKIIRRDSARSDAVLNSFRRGVSSIEILNKAKAPGTAKLLSAYELPTCIITEFVDGPRFSDVVRSGTYDPWEHGLPIIMNTATHVRASHISNEVLHRDIRPNNIIVPDYFISTWDQPFDEKEQRYQVVLLNYDMSWHRGAKGDTVSSRNIASGYQAPEQAEDINGVSARNARVDSYGLGMTIFYAFTRTDPPPAGSKSVDWSELIRKASLNSSKLKWKSAGIRMRRLIECATNPKQSERMDLATIVSQLEMLRSALIEPKSTESASLWADELMYRVLGHDDYSWNDKTSTALIETVAGRFLEINGSDARRRVTVRFTNATTGNTDRATVDKKWPLRLKSAMDILKSGGWSIDASVTRFSGKVINLEALCAISTLQSDVDAMSDTLAKAIEEVRLD